MRSGRMAPLAAAVPVLALALALALSACGKRGDLRAPDDATEAYTYPRAYPNPATVLPAPEPADKPRSRERARGAGDLSPFPDARTTTTYGDPAAP